MLDNILKYWKEVLIGVLTFICIVLIMSTTCVNHENSNLENNIKALRDTIEVVQLKNGDLLSEKQSLILDNKELSEYLDISKSEVKDLQRKLNSKIAQIAELKGAIRIDTLLCRDSIYVIDSLEFDEFRYKDEWLSLSGTNDLTRHQTTINELNIQTPLTIGYTEDRKFFVTSPNPYLNITDINSAIVETRQVKPKHWNVGIQVGVGCQYDLIHKTFGAGPYIGVGLSYGFSF